MEYFLILITIAFADGRTEQTMSHKIVEAPACRVTRISEENRVAEHYAKNVKPYSPIMVSAECVKLRGGVFGLIELHAGTEVLLKP